MSDRLARRALAGAAPLLVWAAHFTLCYLLVAAACTVDGAGGWVRPALLAASALALAAIAWMLRRAWPGAWAPHARLLDRAVGVSGLLALAGTAWTALPLLMLRIC